MDRSIESLTRSIAAGDQAALGRFYAQWFDWMYGQARHVSRRDESFCLDVVHDAMVRIIKRTPVLHSEPELRAWLRTVINSCARDAQRRESRRQVREARAARRRGEAVVPAPNDRGEDALQWLRHRVAALDETEWSLVVLRHREHMSLRLVGNATRLSASAVDGRLARLIAHWRRQAPGGEP